MLLDTAPASKRLISITPLIDVVFILLLFFMLSSVFNKTTRLEVITAGASSGKAVSDKQHTLILLADDYVTLDGQRFSLGDGAYLRRLSLLAEQGDMLRVAARSGVSVQALVSLLDELQRMGLANIKLGPTKKQ
ncbi:ExbD/TolR family protein [Neptunomonas marina]|uniref:Biopolymer transporter ExbD n=1 Tax=Neptunomonas marina TaxID=1815562 RepID=A0A437Q822_9GAMM|nr:biopolymer transporter ExbD [Neptunomonas marina]RVU30629.1 biopolymer transporter ExbD [Neptunomonas marina]